MCIWVRLKDIPSVAFLVPKSTPDEEQLVGFHLSIPMGYVDFSAFFCAITKTVKDRTLYTLDTRYTAPPHTLEDLADTKPPQTSEKEATAKQDSDKNWENPVPARAVHRPSTRQGIPG